MKATSYISICGLTYQSVHIYISKNPDMVKRKKIFRKRMPAPELMREQVYKLLEKMGGSRPKSRLRRLWENWGEAMGEELAGMALPVGACGKTLLIAAENAMQMQELHFRGDELKDRANIFLECEYFSKTRVTLLKKGRKPPEPAIMTEKEPQDQALTPIYPAPEGKYLQDMDMDSPVARCYALFAKAGKQ